MEKLKYPHLFSPITLAGTTFRNRLFASPTGYTNTTGNNVLPEGAAAYYERKAMGGAASVATCELIVDLKYGKGGAEQTCIESPRAFNPLCRIAYNISRHGAVATAELQHAGMYANRALHVFGGAPSGDAYGPVECELEGGRIVKAMDEDMINLTIEKFANAAATAKRAGFGNILLHAGHGWLLHQFLNPNTNTRKDKWGGADIENRARIVVAICDAIKKTVGPKMPLEVRFSGSECYEGGYGIDEGIAIAKQLEGHCDLLHVSAGNHEVEDVFAVTHPSMFIGDAPNVKYAIEIKKNVNMPVATVGAFGNNPEQMEELIASGQVDVIEMARSLIADPDLPLKLRAGREDLIRPCLRCLSCFTNEISVGEKYCAVNPQSGHELESRYDNPKAAVSKKVLIAGGGIGGMQAALTCAERGHKVILCEKRDILGGVIRCEKEVPFKKPLDVYLDRQAAAVNSNPNIEVRMNTVVTPELAKAEAPDAIFAAIGAVPIIPRIPGIDGKNVLEAEYAYTHISEIGQNVLILGAGLVGLELAIHLAIKGHKATVVEMTDHINDGGNFLHKTGLMVELRRRGVDVHLNTMALSINEEGAMCRTPDGDKLFKADTVIYAVGRKPLTEEAYALREYAPEFYVMGDCVSMRNITAATTEAYTAAKNIGRF